MTLIAFTIRILKMVGFPLKTKLYTIQNIERTCTNCSITSE